MKIDNENVKAVSEKDVDRTSDEGKASSVQFIHFKLNDNQITKFKSGNVNIEIGINHNGDINLAKKLIDVACRSGCDAVKFQKRDIFTVYTKDFLKQERSSPWGNTQLDQKKGFLIL